MQNYDFLTIISILGKKLFYLIPCYVRYSLFFQDFILLPTIMKYNYLTGILLILSFLIFGLQNSNAQGTFSGSISNYNAITINENPPILIGGRNSIRLNYSQNFSDGRVYISTDTFNPYAFKADSLDFRLREAYLDLFFENSDLRIGKQIISWGLTQGDFILDILSPYDLSEFITRDFTELREGFTGISYTYYSGRNQFQFILNPAIQPSRLPDYEGRWGVVPADIFPFPSRFVRYEPDEFTLEDFQFAVRTGLRPGLEFDIDFVFMRWIPLNPGYDKQFEFDNLISFIPEPFPASIRFEEVRKPSWVAGFWGEYRPSSDIALQFEAAWFDNIPFDVLSNDITKGDFDRLNRLASGDILGENPLNYIITAQRFLSAFDRYGSQGFLLYKPRLNYMAGFRTDISSWRTTLQYSGSAIVNYNDDILQSRYNHSLIINLQRSFLRDDLLFTLLSRYNFNANDFWVNPEFRYSYSDGLSFSVGSHIFGGEAPPFNSGDLSFQRYSKNSFVFLSVRRAF